MSGTGAGRAKDGRGWSATTNKTGHDTLIVFTSSTEFEAWDGNGPAPSYSKFAAYALLDHRGDYADAARGLADEGYGEERNQGAGRGGARRAHPRNARRRD